MGCVGDFIGRERHDMGYQAIDLQQERIKEMQTQLAMQQAQIQQDAYNQAVQLGSKGYNTMFGGSGSGTISSGQYIHQPTRATLGAYPLDNVVPNVTFEELNDAGSVYNMELQTAIDLAINKFGSGWFKDEDTADAMEENAKFWLQVMSKLFKAGNLVHERYNQSDKTDAGIAWKIRDIDHGNR